MVPAAAMAARSSSVFVILRPPAAVITWPFTKAALSAGDPGTTRSTTGPSWSRVSTVTRPDHGARSGTFFSKAAKNRA